jgi:hypothetical protein
VNLGQKKIPFWDWVGGGDCDCRIVLSVLCSPIHDH